MKKSLLCKKVGGGGGGGGGGGEEGGGDGPRALRCRGPWNNITKRNNATF